MNTPWIQTLLFCALQLFAAWLIYALRPGGRPASRGYYRIRALLPAVALGCLFVLAEVSDNGQQIRVSVDTLRVPTAALQGEQAIFLVGERPENSDLVIPPYIEPSRSFEALGERAHRMIEVKATSRDAVVQVHQLAPLSSSVPGWAISALPASQKVKKVPRPIADGTILPIGTSATRFWVSRWDVGDTLGNHHDRRSFTIARSKDDGALEIKLDQPIRADAGTCNDPQLRLMPSAELPSDATYLPAADLTFAAIGRGGDHPLLVSTSLGAAPPTKEICSQKDPRFTWPTDAHDETRLIGNVHRPFVPWFPLVLVVLTSGLLYWLREAAWIEERVEGNLVFLLQWLLAMRIMIGAAGIFNDLNANVVPVLLDTMMAYICLPFMAVALVMRGGKEARKAAWGMLTFTVLAAASTVLWLKLQSTEGAEVPLGIATASVVLQFWRANSSCPEPLLVRITGWAISLLRQIAGLSIWRGSGAFVLAAGLILAVTLVRALLWWIGTRADDGPRLTEHFYHLPLSLVHVPLLIVGFALLTAAVMARPSWRWLAVPVLAAPSYYLINLLVHDFGVIFVYAWPVGMAIAWYAAKPLWAERRRLAALGMLSTALAPLLVFVYAWDVGLKDIPQADKNLPEHVQAAINWDANHVRLLRFSAPDKIELIGNRAAFENMDQAASLEPLVAGLFGNGYLTPSRVHNPLLRYQYSDNLSAVHLMWPFGRLGTVCLLVFVVLGVHGLVSGKLPPPGQALGRHAMVLAAVMAGITFVWADIYMVMANLYLVPFTGRNVYLLAATSGGDLAEGLSLLLLMCLPWLVPTIPDAEDGR